MNTLKQATRMIAAVGLMASALVVTVSLSSSTPAQAAAYGTLTARDTGRCLEIPSANQSDGARFAAASCDQDDNQLFAQVPAAGGVLLQVLHSEKCVTIQNASLNDGAAAVQTPCADRPEQIFEVINGGIGYRATHSGKCLEVTGFSFFGNSRVLEQDGCASTNTQRFDFSFVKDVGDPDPEPDPDPDPDPDPQPQTIPDDGLVAVPVDASPVVSPRTEVLQAGVIGRNSNNDSFPTTNISVIAITEIDDVMYIGGKFTQVEIAANRQRIDQPFLAAFDRETGAWIDGFRPRLDGNVWDLKEAPNGKLLVAGQFSNVNGAANTSAVALLDPVTGQVDPTWRVSLRLTGSTDRPIARAIDINDDDLYIGGNFTRITGTDAVERQAGRLSKVRFSTGRVDGAFAPDVDGVVFDVAATADRVYAVGNFLYVNDTWSIGETKLFPSDGQIIPGLAPQVRTYTRNTSNSYLQAVLPLGDQVWMTGAQHMTQVYRQPDTAMLRSWVSMPWGDGQALAELNGIVYKGSHANSDTFEYADTTDYPDLAGYTSRKPMRWLGAWDDTARDHLDWYPQIGVSQGEGAWELYADSADCLWAGGDFNRGSYDGDVPRYVQGFARFCSVDTTPPTVPSNPTARAVNDGVNLAWEPSTDNRGGDVTYEILKNDSVFASYVSILTFRDPDGLPTDRYFVRAMDQAGNRSATTRVFTAAGNDTTRPSTPTDLAAVVEADDSVTLTWTASTDNVGVTEYVVYRNGVEIQRTVEATASIADPGAGDHYYQVRALDAAGNESFKTPSVLVTIQPDDVEAPDTPQDLTAEVDADGNVTLTWTEPFDDVGVVDYVVFDTDLVIATVTEPTITIPTPEAGVHYYQVLARDAAGNQSLQTPSVEVVSAVGDDEAPRTPTDLVGVIEDNGDVTLTWTEPFDNVAVAGYFVYRNGVQIDDVAVPTTVVRAPAPGNHWYQVRAYDAAGNESYKTPSTLITISEGDVTPPRTPTDLVGVVEANGDVSLTWTEPFDDVGVTGYIVYRNGVEIQRTATAAATIPAPQPGKHYYQVRAFDGAGNESYKTPSTLITIAGVDTTAPSTPTNLVGVIEDTGDVTLTWTPSTDDIAVTGYIVFRNGVEIQRTTEPTALIPSPGIGSHWYQVRAFDAAGNESFKTPSTRIDIAADDLGVEDVTPPNTPKDLVATIDANGDIVLTWTASVDAVGVTGYIVFDTGAEIQRVSETTALVVDPAPGRHWFQVRAFDAAGNESFKTPSTIVDI